MSKAINIAFTKLKNIKNIVSKFLALVAEGNYIILSKTKDIEY